MTTLDKIVVLVVFVGFISLIVSNWLSVNLAHKRIRELCERVAQHRRDSLREIEKAMELRDRVTGLEEELDKLKPQDVIPGKGEGA